MTSENKLQVTPEAVERAILAGASGMGIVPVILNEQARESGTFVIDRGESYLEAMSGVPVALGPETVFASMNPGEEMRTAIAAREALSEVLNDPTEALSRMANIIKKSRDTH